MRASQSAYLPISLPRKSRSLLYGEVGADAEVEEPTLKAEERRTVDVPAMGTI